MIFPFYSARHLGVEHDICCDRGKKTETILSSLQACFVIVHSIKSPDEWAITKQACRNESIVSLFFPPIATYNYLYICIFNYLDGEISRTIVVFRFFKNIYVFITIFYIQWLWRCVVPIATDYSSFKWVIRPSIHE